ncbi:MAG: MaoC family dehydratase N-terminal domain-containing protein [Pseudomonadota bacterium]
MDPRDAIGRTETATDTLDPRPARLMQVTLDRAPTLGPDAPLPPFWHHLYFPPMDRASDLAEDGHAKLGTFLPDTGLPRRMWAASSVAFERDIRIGDTLTKTSTITNVEPKTGRSGPLVFVTVEHVYLREGACCLIETQTIVYRGMPDATEASKPAREAPGDARFGQTVTPNEALLFRYSALIFYAHRIHYDPDFTRDVEGYPGLIVHGPLIATLLADLGAQHGNGRALKQFDFRAHRPLFLPDPFRIEGRPDGTALETWATAPDGGVAATARLTFAS